MSRVWITIYVVLLGTVSVDLYRFPVYPMDILGYMGKRTMDEASGPGKDSRIGVRALRRIFSESK